MRTYSINVAVKTAEPHSAWTFLFRVDGIHDAATARIVADGIRRGFPGADVQITMWTALLIV